MRVHAFVSSGQRDVYRNAICAQCDNVYKHKIHRLPETPREAQEIDERKLGEAR